MTFIRAPSAPRITCHVTKPAEDWLDVNDRGQYSVRLGERSGGSISFYDAATGDLCAYIDKYTYFTSNPRWNDIPESKHVVSWQPKFIPESAPPISPLPHGEIEPVRLIAALQRPERDEPAPVMSWSSPAIGSRMKRFLRRASDELSRADAQSEYWLFGGHPGENERTLQRLPFARRGAAIRVPRSGRSAAPGFGPPPSGGPPRCSSCTGRQGHSLRNNGY